MTQEWDLPPNGMMCRNWKKNERLEESFRGHSGLSLVPSHCVSPASLRCLTTSQLTVDAGLLWSTISVLPRPDLRTTPELNCAAALRLPSVLSGFPGGPSASSVPGLLCLSAAPTASLIELSLPGRCCPAEFADRGSQQRLHRSPGSLFPQALDLLLCLPSFLTCEPHLRAH